MTIKNLFISALMLFSMAAVTAEAAPQRFEYHIIHAKYGDIGTFINVIDHRGDDTEVKTEIKIAVSMLGIVVYRQEAHRHERWHGRTLVAFDGVTVSDGDAVEVHGLARNGGFDITTANGTVHAPAGIMPANPWSIDGLTADTLMSTRTGRVIPVRITASEMKPVTLGGKMFEAREYRIEGMNRTAVWFDRNNVPVAFRFDDNGNLVDAVLSAMP
ncbi:MAG TPA: DUF6134 family protein [Stellaceae bacterium]|nr:DUF6134 family protein [Stellaceae bacterium]